MVNAEVRCTCGKVTGHVANASRETVNHVLCYCDDCQAFAHHLGRPELLDAHGGSDIVQVAPAAVTYETGLEHIRAVRLKPKGLFRFYADCCKTPLGNTLSPAIPFVGILARSFPEAPKVFGAPMGAILGKFAIGDAPPGSTGLNLGVVLAAIRKVLGWKFGGKTWPHPFFEREGKTPKFPVNILSREERDALRPLCGPKPMPQDSLV